jgi:uncharacterized membrane protein
MSNIITWMSANWEHLALVVTSAVTVASLIVKWTPNTTDDKVLAAIVKVLTAISLNKTSE